MSTRIVNRRRHSTVRIQRPETRPNKPGFFKASVQLGTATLNWYTNESILRENAQQADSALHTTAKEHNVPSDENALKIVARNIMINQLLENKHLTQRGGQLVAMMASWYIWLKRDHIYQSLLAQNVEHPDIARMKQTGHLDWKLLGELVVAIEQHPINKNDYQFSFRLQYKPGLDLPPIPPIDIWQ